MVSRAGAKGSQSTMALSCSQAKAWVKTHYERHEEGVVAKSVMYKHYEDFCRDNGRNIMETSIFGRVVKSVFPDVTIRRLGGRDNLKYYYCGIRAKETSPHAIDNTTTTRPKRRLRKRELVTDKTEVHNCLRWLHANYIACNEASVVKTDVYDAYLSYCSPRGVEPLSAQYFGMVVTYAFPNVVKRKLGPRTNQQKYYFGMHERPDPMSLDLVPSEILTSVEEVFKSGGQASYRDVDNEHVEEEEEEEEYPCRSPESDMSDIASHGLHSVEAYDPEIGVSPQLQQFSFGSFMKEGDSEPVDYSLSSLKLKDEPPEDDDLPIKEEPLDLHISRDILERRTPDRPPSVGAYGSSHSPSPPTKEKARRIYKPRFHYCDESSWNDEPASEEKREEASSPARFFEESPSAATLRNWILKNLEETKGAHVNRDQLYEFYSKYCDTLSLASLPMTFFDETMLKVFRGVVTMIHPSSRTFYEGIRVQGTSPLCNRIEELFRDDSQWVEEENSPNAMELSLVDESTSHSSPLNLEEEEDEPPDETYSFSCVQLDGDHSTPEVLKDGKFYLRKWLTDNFETIPDSCVLKAEAYRHYDLFARNINQTPFEMNVFGKIVRQVFPKVTIRRLGGRLKPQYHYCGIAVKETSPLHPFMSGKDPAQRSRKKEIATDNHSAEIVIEFLHRNYETGKDKATMKSEVFESYTAFCNSNGENPVTLNYFGKLVKHCFPNVEVRKFGGRSEPTWFYFGLFPRGGATYIKYPHPSHSLTYNQHEESTVKEQEHLSVSFNDLNIPMTTSASGLSPSLSLLSVLDSSTGQHFQRHSTSPIPISLNRTHIHPPSHPQHYPGSPPALIQRHLNPASRIISYEEATNVSPADGTPFYREPVTSHSPAEVFYSRSPVDSHTQGQLYHQHPMEGMYHAREQIHHRIAPHLGGGQVVPSQTPPSLLNAHATDHSMGLTIHKKARRPYAIQEEYEIFNDCIGME